MDTGLDYSSCFFIDEDGVEVDHGYFFEELGVVSDSSSYYYTQDSFFVIFLGGNFRADMSRRKVSYSILYDRVALCSPIAAKNEYRDTREQNLGPSRLHGLGNVLRSAVRETFFAQHLVETQNEMVSC